MFKTIKNQKGITLVELLAVMVIVGIIAAISIPAIGNLIENTKKDAYIATAKNMQEAARLVASQNVEDCAKECVVDFAETPAANTIPGQEYIENIDAAYTANTGQKVAVAKVTVKNNGGQVTYETILTGSVVNTSYKLGATGSTPVNALDVMTWTRDVVERVQ